MLLNIFRTARMHKSPKHWSLHTKITMIMTFAIVFMSLIWFLAVEWDNPVLFKDGDVDTRMRRAMVAAVMPRSSGFDLSHRCRG